MKNAIGIHLKKAPDGCDLGISKCFGTPTVPLAWEETFDEDEIFFCQIRLSDIAVLDTENRLPHTGYLYVFLHTAGGERHLRADVRYCDGEPALAIEDFNAAVDGFEQYTEAYRMEFYQADENGSGTRLFGVPRDWQYEEVPPKLLMQYDPLDNDTGFLDSLDGFMYLVFGEDEKLFSQVTVHEEYS